MKRLAILTAAMLAALAAPAAAASISLSGPAVVSGSFDVQVTATDLFDGRDPSDLIISYGFNVAVTDSAVLSFLGATSGPLFDPATSGPGTMVFGAAFGQHGFGIEPGAAEPLLLATLHFTATGSGPASILVSSDLNNLFQGLQFFNDPFQESIAGSLAVRASAPTAVPEPATLGMVAAGLAAAFKRRRQLAIPPASFLRASCDR